jgi:hypothetical protein
MFLELTFDDCSSEETMNEDGYTERLPVVRVTPAMRLRLDRIIANSISPRLSDHLREAVERYVESEERNLHPAGATPAPAVLAQTL